MGSVNDTFLKTILEFRPFQADDKTEGGRTIPGAFPPPNRKIYDFPEGNMYSVLRPARFSPELPQPYETWNDEMSYSRAAEE